MDIILNVNNGYRVTCSIEFENWTKFLLLFPEMWTGGGGAVPLPATEILPAGREVTVRAS